MGDLHNVVHQHLDAHVKQKHNYYIKVKYFRGNEAETPAIAEVSKVKSLLMREIEKAERYGNYVIDFTIYQEDEQGQKTIVF